MAVYTPLGSSGLIVPAAYQSAIMNGAAGGPSLYYPFDDIGTGTARELVQGQTATVYGSITKGVSGPGSVGGFREIASPGVYQNLVQTPSNLGLAIFNNLGPWSVECWFRQTAAQNGPQFSTGMWAWCQGTAMLPAQAPPANSFQPAGYLNWSGQGPAGATNGFNGAATTSLITSAAGFADGNWHQYVYTNDGNQATGTSTLYTDGAQVAQALNVGVNTQYTPGGFQIMMSGNNNRGGPWNGDMAHFSAWTRVLTAAEVTAHFKAMGSH